MCTQLPAMLMKLNGFYIYLFTKLNVLICINCVDIGNVTFFLGGIFVSLCLESYCY